MTANNNQYQYKYHPTSSSTIFTPNSTSNFNTQMENHPKLDSYLKPNNSKMDSLNTNAYSKNVSSQSMIFTNNSDIGKRKGFGLLDGMARKVSTTFKEDPMGQTKPTLQTPSQISTANSLLVNNKASFYNHFPSKKEDIAINIIEVQNASKKKRRQSFDTAAVKDRNISQIMPFLRKGITEINGEKINQKQIQNKNIPINSIGNNKAPQIHQNISINTMNNISPFSTNPSSIQNDHFQGLKQKNYQFLKKKKQLYANEPGPIQTLQSVQSLKTLNTYTSIPSPFKKHQFSSAQKMPINQVKSPEQCDSPLKSDVIKNKGLNYEFKKKKFGQGLSQYSGVPKSIIPNEPKQLMTMKDRRQSKPQRQIKLSDFQLLQKLGKGAFGDVYIAQEKYIGYVCVIKKMSKKRIRESKVQEHILRQIKIQSYLNHTNITQLYGYFHDEQNLYLIIEALPDGSLQQVKKKKKLSQKETALIIKQVSEGLQHMHEESIIHRDLKPQNLFVNQGVIKLGDFGCSIFNNNAGLRTTVVGCLQYSSPQQLSKEAYSQKIDSWSLGILTYQLLYGKSPFQKDIIELTKNKQKKADLSNLTFPSTIPIKQQTKHFIQNLLSQNPDKRMDMHEVLHHQFLKQQQHKKNQKFQFM